MKKVLFLLVLALVSTATYLWFSPTDSSDASYADRELLPDYIAEQVTRTLYDEQGFVADLIQADRLEFFERLGFTQFEQPRYTLFDAEHQAAWAVTSQFGIWLPEDKIILEQDVNISNINGSELLERIQTANLELLLPEKTIQTTAAVQIIGQGFYINGIGLQADLTEQNLRIIKHLETVYTNEQN
ncbi:LPS export ABC transporter periplasmic protein LptC [Arsukibacterium sp.]|uniref:LPS export ABC transporter periplasmic protein LptC n=1 Tax=Arsukibacterium sp. TaxID=1977258 RepID=UPI00299CFD0C|nr:LPS export ABC transporter periplasmic protein LptC [Arsukibacterium sp.]MDX1676800.1 LPS export ABC transporter periplasmic protein LptC [Arsukibacterium sp.]